MLLLPKKIAQRDICSRCSLPQRKRDRRPRRNVKCSRLIGLFTACKLCLYKKRGSRSAAGLNSSFSTKRNHTSLSPSLCPHEECVRALWPVSSASDVPRLGKRKKKMRISPHCHKQPLFLFVYLCRVSNNSFSNFTTRLRPLFFN